MPGAEADGGVVPGLAYARFLKPEHAAAAAHPGDDLDARNSDLIGASGSAAIVMNKPIQG